MADYLPLVVMLVLAVVFVVGSLLTTSLLAPRRPTVAKAAPYESGIVPTRERPARFPVRFFLVAMIFIIFDIEIVFLYPWAVVASRLGWAGFAEMALFVSCVFVAFIYLLSRGALDWGPVARVRRAPQGATDPARTTTSTVRLVGLDGRDDREMSP